MATKVFSSWKDGLWHRGSLRRPASELGRLCCGDRPTAGVTADGPFMLFRRCAGRSRPSRGRWRHEVELDQRRRKWSGRHERDPERLSQAGGHPHGYVGKPGDGVRRVVGGLKREPHGDGRPQEDADAGDRRVPGIHDRDERP